jgi:uncharacterized membrane protein
MSSVTSSLANASIDIVVIVLYFVAILTLGMTKFDMKANLFAALVLIFLVIVIVFNFIQSKQIDTEQVNQNQQQVSDTDISKWFVVSGVFGILVIIMSIIALVINLICSSKEFIALRWTIYSIYLIVIILYVFVNSRMLYSLTNKLNSKFN